MVVLLLMLAFGMIATGLAAMVFGTPIVNLERGWTMVIAGSVGATGGALLLGCAVVAHRLGRVAREMAGMRDRLASIGEIGAELAADSQQDYEQEEPVEPPQLATAPPPQPAPFQPQPAPARQADRVVVGQYSSGGNAYTMFADGSIDAQTPAGLRRFSSLDELRAFVAGGGERGG